MKYTHFFLALIWNSLFCAVRKIVGWNNIRRYYYYGEKIKNIEETNNIIAKMILSGKPFLIARFGAVELRSLLYYKAIEMKITSTYPQYIREAMELNAGFFPVDDESLNKFGEELWQSSKSVDLFGVWYNLMEDYIIHMVNKKAILTVLENLEPYRAINPWSKALAGKKVLVIHPFEESIKRQYTKREKLFANKNVLPSFNLLTYKAIQTNAGGTCKYPSWFDALNKMFSDIKEMDFDIAIVACGAYGLPLAAKIKSIGKQAIHLAGATQILFGIRGTRWDNRPDMQVYFNEEWVRPLPCERPKDAIKVESACYW